MAGPPHKQRYVRYDGKPAGSSHAEPAGCGAQLAHVGVKGVGGVKLSHMDVKGVGDVKLARVGMRWPLHCPGYTVNMYCPHVLPPYRSMYCPTILSINMYCPPVPQRSLLPSAAQVHPCTAPVLPPPSGP